MAYGLHSQKKTAQYLLLAYCLFIVYGSFLPFHFNLDPNFVRWRWEVFLLEPIQGHTPRASASDIVSNILLFVPFGALCIWVWMAKATRERAVLPVLLTGAFGLVFGVAIESGQTLSPWRSPSPLDVLFNGTGAFIGAVAGRMLFRNFERSVQTRFVQVLRERPSLLALAYLFLGVLVDSFYPFAVTLDVSAIWQNVKQSQWIPFNEGLQRYGLDLLIRKGAIFAAIGHVVSLNIGSRKFPASAPLAWLLCSVLAFSIETGKLFFAGRAFHSENVIIGSLGALAGILLIPRLPTSVAVNRRPQTLWFMLVLCFLIYYELSPFDWISPSELSTRLSRIEWLPFKSYYSAEPLNALFDLQQKVYYLMPLGLLSMSLQRAALPRNRALLACVVIAAGLESLQIFVRSRIPSTTDLIIFSASAWAGIALFTLFQSMKIEMFHAAPPGRR